MKLVGALQFKSLQALGFQQARFFHHHRGLVGEHAHQPDFILGEFTGLGVVADVDHADDFAAHFHGDAQHTPEGAVVE